MKTKTKRQYDGDALREMREQRGLSQKEFWGAIGYKLSRGCAYETGRTTIPEHVNRLVFLHYAAGIPTDINSAAFAEFEEDLKKSNPARLGAARKLLNDAIQELKK